MLRNRALVFAVLAGTAVLAAPYRASADGTLDIVATGAGDGGLTITYADPYNSATTSSTGGVIAGEMVGWYLPGGGNAGANPGSAPAGAQTIYTFCVDMLHDINLPSSFFNVNASALTSSLNANGGAIQYLYQTYAFPSNATIVGITNYSLPSIGGLYPATGIASINGNDYAAGLQLAIWALLDPGSGATAFKVSGENSATLAAYNYFLAVAANPANTDLSTYLDAGNGNNPQGQSFLYPPPGSPGNNVTTPAPSSLTLACIAIGCVASFGQWRRKRLA